jgi:hypothetical protein
MDLRPDCVHAFETVQTLYDFLIGLETVEKLRRFVREGQASALR